MNREHYQRVRSVFHAASELNPADRAAYLDESCADSSEIRRDVEELLALEDTTGAEALEQPVLDGAPLRAIGDSFASDPALDDLSEARTIGPYRVVRKIGQGGMGSVYEAQQEHPRRTVALKVLHPGGASNSQFLKRFRREIDVLGRLHHPGIAQIFDAGIAEINTDAGVRHQQPYFAMELIPGEPLDDYARHHDLDQRGRLELIAQICDAVHHAHERGVIHRDLKPGNILVEVSGRPKVLDFGVARATNADIHTVTLQTEAGQLVGTIPYMSPEQVAGDPDALDARSDVYSLGVVLYELLAGRLPYDLKNRPIPEAVRIIQEQDPTRLSSIHHKMRGDIETIVGKALEKEKNRRYPTAAALADDIRRYLTDQPLVARPTSTLYQLRKFTRRNKGLVGGLALTLVVLIGGLISTGYYLIEAIAARAEADVEATRADKEKAVAQAVNDFLTKDLLAAVAPSSESGKGKDVLMRDVLDKAAERIEEASRAGGRFAETPLVEASIRATLGWTYYLLGEYTAAEPHLERARLLRRRELGAEHADTLDTMNNLALLYVDQGRYDEAEPIHVKTLEIRKRVLGEEHAQTLDSMQNLATLYWAQGRYDEANPLQVKTLEIRKRVLGEEHAQTLGSMHNLANLYWAQGRYDEAMPLVVKTLEIRKRVLGEEDAQTLDSMINLANLHNRQGRYDEARPLYLRTLEIQKRVLGEEHPKTLGSMHNVALLYLKQGRHDEAEQMWLRTLEMQKRVLGEEHPNTLRSLVSIANLYVNQGRYDEAEPLYVKTLKIQKRDPGEEHPNTLGLITNLGNLYLSMKRFDDARAMFESSLPIKRRLLGMGHPWTQYALEGLAQAYDALDRGDDALPLWRELQEFQLAQAEDPDASTQVLNAAAWGLLTNEHAELRDPTRALLLAQRAVDKVGGVDPGIFDTLALAQHLTGDTPAAIETEKKALSLLPLNTPDRGDYEANLARFEAALVKEDQVDQQNGG